MFPNLSKRSLPTSRAASILPLGKVPASLLRRLLAMYAKTTACPKARLVVGPGIGLDAAAIDFHPQGGQYLIAKTDPITFVAEDIGHYALVINANDLATMGVIPRWFLVTLLFPPKTSTDQISYVFSQLRSACCALDVTLCGGHTELTDAVTRPVVIGCLLGDCPKPRLITTAGARVGDVMLLTKGIPIEAVSVLARERGGDLGRYFSARFIARCRRYLYKPGISIVRDAQLALAVGGVHAMHDPTEGGLSTALYELAEAAGVGLVIDQTAVPILPEGAQLCRHFGIDPLGAIASGALLISAEPRWAPRLQRHLAQQGITTSVIGRVVPRRQGVKLRDQAGKVKPLPRFAQDEIARVLDSSSSTGQC
ncbi:MAG: hypothetical protein D6704_12280 [Nitrospirae bacterium]|nr:MAG: hypothetical protein D6704_12280 [Nitrospirota bacterium]